MKLFFLLVFFYLFNHINIVVASSQENNFSISREELRAVVKGIKENGWDTGLCDWRGLDSDVYLDANEKYEFDEVTSLYRIHCFAGASHDKYQFLFSIKGDVLENNEKLYMIYFPYPFVEGYGPGALKGMGISDYLSNAFYEIKEQMIKGGSHYRAGDAGETVFYKLYYEGKGSIPQFHLQKFTVDSLHDNISNPNYEFIFDKD